MGYQMGKQAVSDLKDKTETKYQTGKEAASNIKDEAETKKGAFSNYATYTKYKVKLGLWKMMAKVAILGSVLGYGYYRFVGFKDHSA